MTLPRIGVILSTTREGRFADKPAQWLLDIAAERTDLAFELVDLRDYDLPFFDRPASPITTPVDDEAARRWAGKIAALDGYVFVVAEYNHSIPGVLKNALDFVYPEFNRKPAAYVGYGGVGAARAVEQLRLINVEQQVAPTRAAVHIGMEPFLAVMRDGRALSEFDYLNEAARLMLDDLAWWTKVLKTGREATAAEQEKAA
jgi:NAD(P)H-dependent FMN reductase